MSDYISKSALLKNLWDWRLQECPVGVCDEETETYKTICECIKAVEELPTLDETEIIRKPMERILTRLEEKENEAVLKAPITSDIHNPQYQKWMMKSYGFKESIQVVKEEGGIE